MDLRQRRNAFIFSRMNIRSQTLAVSALQLSPSALLLAGLLLRASAN